MNVRVGCPSTETTTTLGLQRGVHLILSGNHRPTLRWDVLVDTCAYSITLGTWPVQKAGHWPAHRSKDAPTSRQFPGGVHALSGLPRCIDSHQVRQHIMRFKSSITSGAKSRRASCATFFTSSLRHGVYRMRPTAWATQNCHRVTKSPRRVDHHVVSPEMRPRSNGSE